MQSEPINNINQITTSNFIGNLELVYSGEDYFLRLLNIITAAKHEIHLQTFTFEDDTTGLEIAEALKKAADRKVKIYILVDGYGSSKLPNAFLESLREYGINARFFSPFFSKNNFYIGRRLHHKIVVIDGEIVLIGGINIANTYRGSNTAQAWLDYAVEIESKTIAQPLQQLCRYIYLKKRRYKINTIQSTFCNQLDVSVKILRNDRALQRNEISKAYINALQKADTEIIIVASYFLPGRRLLNALKKAARRGVKIKIILSGVSDLPIVMRATHYLYSSLLKQGIELFEWNKSVLHGKLAVADSKWATIGSFNLNHLSSYASIEMNAEINSAEFSKNLSVHLINVLNQCNNITLKTHITRNGVFTKLINWLAFRLIRIALIIATYIPHKRLLKLN
jgi:cardiolipin synthase